MPVAISAAIEKDVLESSQQEADVGQTIKLSNSVSERRHITDHSIIV